MSEPATIPAPQYTLIEALTVCLAMCQRALTEVRALARLPGPPGAKGATGDKGERGAKGEPGRNAADLTLLEEYIEERVERAFKAATVTTPDHGRTMLWSVGGKVHEIKTAVVLDAGIWKDGAAYSRGDGVSVGGSWFIAQTDSTTARPGKSDEWRLAVKRGTDGRDARHQDDKRELEPVRFK